MSKLALDKFIALVERSQLIEPARLASIVDGWKQQATLAQLDNAQFLADHLVATGVLTAWQCHKLLDGRHRGFFLGRYKLLDHLGSGGMSNVYLAEHVLMQRLVAIKVLPQNRVQDATYLAQFHVEAQAAAALDHRNIVRAYDLASEGRIHFLVMEYVEGTDLHALVSQQGPLDYCTAANFVAQAAAGLEHAHQRGLVHRDIKPANLLVDPEGTVKILDMGLAKFTCGTRGGHLHQDQVIGTADYLAPEQAVDSRSVDRRADIYGLGCTLYFLLTGRPPFAQGTSQERVTAHRNQEPPNLLLDRPDVPLELMQACERMMQKRPEDRFQTAEAVRATLAAWLDRQPGAGQLPRPLLVAAASASQGGARYSIAPAHSDEPPPPPLPVPPPVTASFQDTDLNLQRATVRMPAAGPGSAVTESHVLASGVAGGGYAPSPSDVLMAPPVVAPPVQQAAKVTSQHVTPVVPRDSSPLRQMLHPKSPASVSSKLWIVLISALVTVAILLIIASASR